MATVDVPGGSAIVTVVGGATYTILSNDEQILVDTSADSPTTAQAVIKFPATGLVAGRSRINVTWWGWADTSPPPLLDGNGNQLTPYRQTNASQVSKALVNTDAVRDKGGSYSAIWTGSFWMGG